MKSSFISRPAAIVIVICFFLPFITLSCSGSGVQMSGYDMATGIDVYSQQVPGDVLYFVFPVLGIIALGGSFLRVGEARITYFVTSLVGLGFMLERTLYWQRTVTDTSRQQGVLITLTYEIGWWLMLFGYLAILLAGFIVKQELDSEGKKNREEWLATFKPNE